MTSPSVELEIPSRSVYVAVVRLALASVARSAGLDEEVVDDLKIAVSEGCTNAVLSNEEAGVDAPVMVSWTEEEDHVVIEIADQGAPYDPDGPVEPDRGGFSSRLMMSVALLKSLVDDCEFVPGEGSGMRTRLIFTR